MELIDHKVPVRHVNNFHFSNFQDFLSSYLSYLIYLVLQVGSITNGPNWDLLSFINQKFECMPYNQEGEGSNPTFPGLLFLFYFYPLQSVLNAVSSRRCSTKDVPLKIYLAMFLEAKEHNALIIRNYFINLFIVLCLIYKSQRRKSYFSPLTLDVK